MPIPKECPRIWHCIFCGKHGLISDFQIELPEEQKQHLPKKFWRIQACPQCKEYKGLEPCDPETCECWELDVIRKLAETDAIKRILWRQTVEEKTNEES